MEEVKEFIEKVDSASPAPGGGAVAAYTSSLAVLSKRTRRLLPQYNRWEMNCT